MLKISEITYSVAGKSLFESASANIPTGHKVGLIGRNGTGKTTLFRLIQKQFSLQSGEISLPKKTRIGSISQDPPSHNLSLLETVLAEDQERTKLLEKSNCEEDPEKIAEMQTRLSEIDAWSAEARASTILKGLGFDRYQQETLYSSLSGGWRMRVALASSLFTHPDLLLLDEPTNYLDLEGAIWLENFLAKYPRTFIIISHDRRILNYSINSILHLEDRKLTLFKGTFDKFSEERQNKIKAIQAEKKRQEAKRSHLESYVRRFRFKADKARQAQSRIKKINRMTTISLPQEIALKQFSFPEPEKLAPPILRLEECSVGYNERPVLKRLELRIDQDDRIALLGKNGQGKSTLAKLIARKLKPISGKLFSSPNLRIGYFSQHQVDELLLNETPLDHIKRLKPEAKVIELYNILASFSISAEQSDTKIRYLSGGQKVRLSLLTSTLEKPHIMILDEPTNHLDLESREALVIALKSYSGAIIIISHDFHLLSLTVDKLWLVKQGEVSIYNKDLEDYRQDLLSHKNSSHPKKDVRGSKKEKRDNKSKIVILRKEVEKSEKRLEKLHEMREKLAKKLSEPSIYTSTHKNSVIEWNRKYSEIKDAIVIAENLWVKAVENLEDEEA